MRLSIIQQRSDSLGRKKPAAVPLPRSLKRGRLSIEPLTPEDVPVKKFSRVVPALPGSHIHLSQSADGKLRWIPPSSSSSSKNDGESFSGCFSSDSCPVSTISPAFTEEEIIPASRSLSSRNKSVIAHQKSSVLIRASPSLASCYHHLDDSESSLGRTVDTVDDSDAHELSIGSHYQVPSVSELSFSSLHLNADAAGKKLGAFVPDSLPRGLSPYLSAKLKPGKHILGAKTNQVFIRPGQLRYWAVGNSPSLASSLVNKSAVALKGKACRTLAF